MTNIDLNSEEDKNSGINEQDVFWEDNVPQGNFPLELGQARISFIVSSESFDIKAIKGLERVSYDDKEVGHGVKNSGFFFSLQVQKVPKLIIKIQRL